MVVLVYLCLLLLHSAIMLYSYAIVLVKSIQEAMNTCGLLSPNVYTLSVSVCPFHFSFLIQFAFLYFSSACGVFELVYIVTEQ